MFLPQISEDDVFDANDKQLDDVNSVIEYFQVALGYDHHADDEDDDNGQNFHLVKNVEYNFQQIFFPVDTIVVVITTAPAFYHRDEDSFQSMTLEIDTPPPDLS
jgi:hypothetical protein